MKKKTLILFPFLALLLLFTSCKSEKKDTAVVEEIKTEQEVMQEPVSTNEVFKVVEDMPRFPGCEDLATVDEKNKCANEKMLAFIFDELKYPEEAKAKRVEGRVISRFVVDETGKLVDIQILEDIGEGCGDEVKRVLESMNNMDNSWIAGKQRGKNVKVELTLPVVFKLDSGEK